MAPFLTITRLECHPFSCIFTNPCVYCVCTQWPLNIRISQHQKASQTPAPPVPFPSTKSNQPTTRLQPTSREAAQTQQAMTSSPRSPKKKIARTPHVGRRLPGPPQRPQPTRTPTSCPPPCPALPCLALSSVRSFVLRLRRPNPETEDEEGSHLHLHLHSPPSTQHHHHPSSTHHHSTLSPLSTTTGKCKCLSVSTESAAASVGLYDAQ
jgi:hypothetical protein